jgi:polysaccharide biosynthesis transport protein
MTLEETAHNVNGHGAEPVGQPSRRRRRGGDQEMRLASLTARELRLAPGGPASWPRFLAVRALWILAVTIVTIGGAAALVFSQTPLYRSQAVVNVEPAAVAASSGNPPNMATEEGVATSSAVLAKASRQLHVPVATLASRVTAHVPGTTTLLQITYADPDPRVAQQRAQAIAAAYVSYRSPQPAAAPGKSTAKSAPLSMNPTAVLVTPASLPTSPAVPDKSFDLGIAVIIGLVLGVGTAVLRDHMDDRLRGPLDLENRIDAPVLALIPAFVTRRRNPGSRLVMLVSPGSLVAEAYRGLRAQVVQAATSRNAKTLLITSLGWEDKSTVAANLAVALAQSFRSVVLVCADLRWGRADEPFACRDGDHPNGRPEGGTNPVGSLRATGVPGLQLLPPGAIPADPLLEQPAWHAWLSDIRRHADLVVIEGPPILATADARPVIDVAEMILIVADARMSTRARAQAAMREVRQVRAKVVGCVLDNVGRRRCLRSHGSGLAAEGGAMIDRWRLAAQPKKPAATDSGPGRVPERQAGPLP